MTYITTGEEALRAENIDAAIKNIALRKYVMKQVVSTPTSSSWSESYYRETNKNLNVLAHVPRGAAFPVDVVDWEKNTAYMQKAGLESEVLHEDVIANNIDVIARSLLRVSNAIVRSVDSTIWSAISNATGRNTVAASATWNNATRASRVPHEDLGLAIEQIVNSDTQSYMPDTLLVTPKDFIYLITNDYVIDAFNPSGNLIEKNGFKGTILGLKVLVSPIVDADEALVCESKICGTYRTAEGLKTMKRYDEGVKHVIRGWEIGTAFATDVKAICSITNTQA